MLTPLCFPDAKLKQAAKPIAEITDAVKTTAEQLIATLYQYNLIGIAATHCGVMQQIIVIDLSKTQDQAEVLLNPKIISQSGKLIAKETGIAMPGIEVDIERATDVTVEVLTLCGEQKRIAAQGLQARVLQHEIDQMNGILFIDRVSKVKRDRAIKAFNKQAKHRCGNHCDHQH
jgi:peptide deformylase